MSYYLLIILNLIDKKFQLKNDKEKANNNYKMRIKINIKIKL